jgi:hypothetical protein
MTNTQQEVQHMAHEDWNQAQATFIVAWNDGVCNEWVEAVRGPVAETDDRLTKLAQIGRGEREFSMSFICLLGHDNIKVQTTMTADEFFALPWEDSFDEEYVKRGLLRAVGRG